MMAASCIFAAGSLPGFILLLWKVRIMFKDWLQKLMNNGTGKVSSTVQNELHNEINHEVLIESEHQHDHDFRLTLTGLEARLHTSESNEEIIMEAIKTACDFYEAEWAGILIADVETEAWAPMTCYNRITGRMESRYTKEIESFEGFGRWVEAFFDGRPLVVPDASVIRKRFPDEFQHYQRLDVQSLIGTPFGEKPTGFFVVKNPTRYKTYPDMAQMLAFVSMTTFYLQELQQSMAEMETNQDQSADEHTIRINLLGIPEVCVGGKKLDMRVYASDNAWKVISYLALKGKPVPGSTLIENIWPKVKDASDTNPLRSALYQMRSKFQFLCPNIVSNNELGYWFNPDYRVEVDAVIAEQFWSKASSEKNHVSKLIYLKNALRLFRGHLCDNKLDEPWMLSYYHAYNSLYAQIIIAFLDELGKDENYTEIHKYASGALIMLDGSPRICFWLTVATYYISGRSAAIEVINANRSSLSSEEFDLLMREVEAFIKDHGGTI